jgi:glycosyltransferase involved in cell wall biosynthesis
VEALAAGLVVVSSGTGGAKEIIRNETDGLLFTAGDEADLTDKLTMLANDPELMARLQRQGQARAAAFSVENSVLKIEALADELQAVVAAEMEPAEPV